ncbi:MAG: VanZ family protein [Rhodoferax sp.]|nr:VanZ family protein [Rhodoferax sp.]
MLALMPTVRQMPSTGWDKGNHLLAFTVLAVLGLRAYPVHTVAVLSGLLVFGGLIELLQSLTPDRMAEWADWLADSLGLLLGWGIVLGWGMATSEQK